jgi:hypothetical protein
MSDRRYYSVRTGKNPFASQLDLPIFLRLFKDLYMEFIAKDYFQEAFGYYCVDAGEVPGILGHDIEFHILRKIRKSDLWPVFDKYSEYSEDDVFDMIEFLYDHISKPLDGNYHSYGDCGWHYHTFDAVTGRQEYRTEINEFLRDYKEGYELSIDGEILALPDEGLTTLLDGNLPAYDPDNVDTRVKNAVLKFRRHRSSLEDRRDAIRDLADVLEYLRPKLELAITRKDENDLFNIANNFGIRHHNESQKTDYDKSVWYSWIFYYYLATFHAAIRLIKQHEQNNNP